MKRAYTTLSLIALAMILLTYFSFHFFNSTQQSDSSKLSVVKNKISKQERIDQAFELEFLKTVDPNTNTVPRERLIKAKAYTKKLLQEKGAIPNIDWEERGPDNVGGRTRAVIFDASDATN